MGDISDQLRERILQANEDHLALRITGGGSKQFYGAKTNGEPLAVAGHSGILEFEPTELVVTARGGTLLSELEATLAEKGQMLAFEPPGFGSQATLAGTVACGFSGPRRPYTGALRDFVLGCTILNGKGEILSFGGQVMKNVAGYDVSRLMVGALGSLGVVLDVSLKVLPRPETEITVSQEIPLSRALLVMNNLAAQPLPLSAMCWHADKLYVRLSGTGTTVSAAAAKIGGDRLDSDLDFWRELREHQLPFFQPDENLWRISVAPATEFNDLPGDCLIDWGGAQRWLRTDLPAESVFRAASVVQGHATLFRPKLPATSVFQPLPEQLMTLHKRLKAAFDPEGILNPHCLYEDF